MIEIVVSAAMIASVSSVSTAYVRSRGNYNRAMKPVIAKEIETLFPESIAIMPAFQRAVEARAKTKIRPLGRRNARLMRQYDKMVTTLAEAKRGKIKKRQILAAGKICWSIITVNKNKGYGYHSIDNAHKSYSHLVSLHKGRMPEEFIDEICNLVNLTFYVHAKQFIDPNYKNIVNLDHLRTKYQKIVDRELTGITSDTNN